MAGNGWSNQVVSVIIIEEGTGFTGLFFYSPTIGPGTLIGSWAAEAGTDPYGNTYPQGISIGLNSGPRVVIGLTGGTGLIYFPSTVPGEADAAAMQSTDDTTFSQLIVKSARMTATTDYVAASWQSSSDDGTDLALWHANYVDETSTVHTYLSVGLGGAMLIGSVTAVEPGTGTSRANPAAAETWHTASLGAGWTTSGSDQVPRYRLEGTAGGVVRLDGTVYSTGANAIGTTMFTLPIGYRPTERRRYTGLTNGSPYAAGQSTVMVNTNGTVVNEVATTAASQQICLDGITFPVD